MSAARPAPPEMNPSTRKPDGYAVVQKDGHFVGIWRVEELAHQIVNRSPMSKGETVRPMVFFDAAPTPGERMNAPEQLSTGSPAHRLAMPAIGSPLPGGICLGHIFVAGEPFALVVPPKIVREHPPTPWSSSRAKVSGATSYFDGLANTRAMAEAGSPLGKWALDQHIAGLDDWFIPSRQDAMVIAGNLAAAGDPFKAGAAEAFDTAGWYWTSTQSESHDACAWVQDFEYGVQYGYRKSDERRVCLVRREPIR